MKRYSAGLMVGFLSFFYCIHSTAQGEFNEKLIVAVVPSFNNKDWFVANLGSILDQRYGNFKVIYINDASDDGTGEFVEEYIANHPQGHRCTIVQNTQRYGPLYNRYRAIHSCPDDAVILLVDGDDSLAHPDVFSYLNRVYSEEDILMTVGNACKSSTGQKIGHRDYTKDEWELFGIRSLGFRGVHPRTFYAGLFKRIRLQDLFFSDLLYPMATDVACLIPMFEMARDRYKYITDILYVYNDQNRLNMSRKGFQTQIYCDMMIRNRKPYEKLQKGLAFESERPVSKPSVSCIGFITQKQETYQFIDQCNASGIELESMFVIGSRDYKPEIFNAIAKKFDFFGVACDLQTIYSFRVNIRDRLHQIVSEMQSDYILIAHDNFFSEGVFNFDELSKTLENTGAQSIVFGRNPSDVIQSYYAYDMSNEYKTAIARPWNFLDLFEATSSCWGIFMRRDLLHEMISSMTVFYPNFYTFFASWHSVLPLESVVLTAFLDEERTSI